MALKGSISKEIVAKKILETFEGSFQYEKEIRIPMEEDGNQIQLKCVLTCAKTNVEPNGENAIPGEVTPTAAGIPASEKTFVEPTQEEKDNVQKLMQMLNL
jgi:hypothetical protein